MKSSCHASLFSDLPQSHANRAPILAVYDPNPARRRSLQRTHYMNRREIEKLLMAGSVSSDGEPGRALQSSFGSQKVKFVESAFVDNRANDGVIELAHMGVVTSLSEYNELTFIRSIFTLNVYNGDQGYAVKTGGSKLIIQDTCIFENVFAGPGVIQHFGSGSIESTNNLVRYNGYNLTCEFIAQSPQSGLLRFDVPDNITCIEPDAEECALTANATESDAPSTVPSSTDGNETTAPAAPTRSSSPPPSNSTQEPDSESDMPSSIPTIPDFGSSSPPAADNSTGQPTPSSNGTASPAGGDNATDDGAMAPTSLSSDAPSSVPSTQTIAKSGGGGVSSKGGGIATSQAFLLQPLFFHIYALSLVPFILLHLYS
jgi:hypothetical protein